MSKWQLFSLLAENGPANFVFQLEGRNVIGILLAVERESGDGRHFNARVKIPTTGETRNVFIATID